MNSSICSKIMHKYKSEYLDGKISDLYSSKYLTRIMIELKLNNLGYIKCKGVM